MRTFLRFFRRHLKTIEELEISRRPGAISNILREIADTCEGVPRIRAFVNSSFGKKNPSYEHCRFLVLSIGTYRKEKFVAYGRSKCFGCSGLSQSGHVALI